MASFFDTQYSPRNSWSFEAMKNVREISPTVQNHLKLVYMTLCCALGAFAAGAYLHIVMNIGGLMTIIASFVGMYWLFSLPQYEERKRFGILMGIAMAHGASLGLLIKLAIDLDPSILVSACGGTAIAFGCFSAAAIVAKRREFLYLGGLLSSGISILFWLQFASLMFGRSAALLNVDLYFGLLVFLGYIVFDTQAIIERAHHGDLDYMKDALLLFVDLIAVLVRIISIMLKNSSKRSEEKKRKKSS